LLNETKPESSPSKKGKGKLENKIFEVNIKEFRLLKTKVNILEEWLNKGKILEINPENIESNKELSDISTPINFICNRKYNLTD
jgi:hypothetical protein